jgi:hypothetical protein
MFDSLDYVAPSSSQFAGALACLDTRAGRQELLVAQKIADLLAESTHPGVMESS